MRDLYLIERVHKSTSHSYLIPQGLTRTFSSKSLSLHLTPTFLPTSSQNDSIPIPFPLISLITLTKRNGQLSSIAIEF